MTSLQLILVILVVGAILAAPLWQWYRSRIFKRASGLARRVFPVWAAQGPFDSGEESAAAMRYAYLAVFGSEEAERMGMMEAVANHAAAYDRNPGAWEQNRQKAMRSANSETEEFVTIAKGLAAMDSLNKDFLESGGHKLELATQSDGSLGIAYKKIWSDEAIEEKKKQDNEAHQSILESTEGALPWSSNPGAYEAHLMRRHNNSYFPESRRNISHEDLAEAKKQDREDYMSCQQRFEQLGKKLETLSPTTTSGELLKLREELDDLILFSLGVGGSDKEIASKADQVRDAVIEDLRSAFSHDEGTLKNIEKADNYHKDNTRRFYVPVMAQMLRENSPVLKEETIPTILSEDPSAIAIFINSLPEESRALIEVEGLKILRESLDDGYIDPQCEEKIFALRGEWPISRK